MLKQPVKSELLFRWMIRADHADVLAIEAASFEQPWNAADLRMVLRDRNVIGKVIERKEEIIGYAIYEMQKRHLKLLNLAVTPEYRFCGLGSWMVSELKKKLTSQRRRWIKLEMGERNLAGQLFFRANGFKAVASMRGFYSDGQDCYHMQFDVADSRGGAGTRREGK